MRERAKGEELGSEWMEEAKSDDVTASVDAGDPDEWSGLVGWMSECAQFNAQRKSIDNWSEWVEWDRTRFGQSGEHARKLSIDCDLCPSSSFLDCLAQFVHSFRFIFDSIRSLNAVVPKNIIFLNFPIKAHILLYIVVVFIPKFFNRSPCIIFDKSQIFIFLNYPIEPHVEI